MIYMSSKRAAILMLVLGIICLADGIVKRDIKELLVAVALLGCGSYKLIAASKKIPDNKIGGSTTGKPGQQQ